MNTQTQTVSNGHSVHRPDTSAIPPKTTFEVIGPDKAREYLETIDPKRQRPVVQSRVEQYARDINAGDFHYLPGQGIHIDVLGALCNGQHRLLAVVKTGKSIEADVTRNFPLEAIPYLDQGKSRTMAHMVAIEYGVDCPKEVCALVEVIRHLDSVDERHDSASPTDVMRMFNRHRLGIDWAQAQQVRRPLTVAPILGAFAYAYPVDPISVNSLLHHASAQANMVQGGPGIHINGLSEKAGRGSTKDRRAVALKVLGCLRYWKVAGTGATIPRLNADESHLEYWRQLRKAAGIVG